MPTVKFIREKKTIEVEYGANLRTVAIENGIELYPGIHALLNCRGFGLCHTCRVRCKNDTMKNASRRRPWERLQELSPLSWYAVGDDEVRLSCQMQVLGDLEIETKPTFNWSGEFK